VNPSFSNATANVLLTLASYTFLCCNKLSEAKLTALSKGNYEAAIYDAKTKEILSQPKLLELYRAETERVWAQRGVSPYGNNNVFGSASGIFLNRK